MREAAGRADALSSVPSTISLPKHLSGLCLPFMFGNLHTDEGPIAAADFIFDPELLELANGVLLVVAFELEIAAVPMG